MATQVQFRRGTAAQNNAFTGAEGELSVNLSNYSLRLHDGSTAGGYEIARKDFTNATFGATVLPTLNTTYNLGSSTFKFLNVHSQEFTGDLTGNADTATALQTARTINGVSFDGTADITIEAEIEATLFISEGLEDSGGLSLFDGSTDVTLRLKNSPNFSDTNLLKWDNTNEQFVDSIVTDNGTTVTAAGNLTVTGDLLVQGATTTISTTNLEVTDKLIIIGDGTTTTQAADGAGFNIGTSGVSLTYDLANTSWTSSESFNLATGKTYKIAGTTVIGSTSLGANIVSSSLTSVGTLTDLTVQGAVDFNTTLNVDGQTNLNGNVYIPDNQYLFFGTGNDLSIGHNGTHSYIQELGDGGLRVYSSEFTLYAAPEYSEPYFYATRNGGAYLYYNGTNKLGTVTDGVEILDNLYVKDTIRKDGTNLGLVEDAIVKLNQTGGNAYTFDEWSYTTYSACEYSVSCVNPTAGEQQFARFIVMATSGGDRYMTEYAGLSTDSANDLFALATASNSGNIRLNVTPSNTNSDNDFRIKVTRYYR